MNLWKKSIYPVISIMLAISLLAGCGGSQNGSSEQTGTKAQNQSTSQAQASDAKPVEVTLKYLNCWNTSGSIAPQDPLNNPVAQELKKRTGVTLEVEYATTSENEKLNLIFATGDMPDIINGPFWGGTDGSTVAFKKAAQQGLILPLDELLDKYSPHLKEALTLGVTQDFIENDLKDPVLGGKSYFIPWQTARTEKDITHWAYNTFVRGDILKALGIKPEDIQTSDDLYQLMKKIKDGGFKDINGKPVIPAGTFANGWTYGQFLNTFRQPSASGYIDIDGKVRSSLYDPNKEQEVLFMRKLVSEGLIDKECFRQNDTIAKEKLSAGKIAIVGSHYPYMRDLMETTLYKEHPEMRYVPVGPIQFSNGEKIGQLELGGRAGSPILCLTKTCADPDAAIRFIDFLNSDEGKKLSSYGIEGTHYTLVDGKPRMTKEWLEKFRADPQTLRNEGIQSVYTWFITLDDRLSKWGEKNPGDSEKTDENYDLAVKFSPMKVISGYRLSSFQKEYPEYDKIVTLTNPDTQRDAIEKAYFAKTDEEALKIFRDYKEMLIKGGYEEFCDWLTDKAKGRNDILY